METDLATIVQTFQKIITANSPYADKTEYIYKLLKYPQAYFLWRPRRFGKSLLLDTMDQLFRGNRELFRGLWIYGSDYKFDKYPVIRLSMDFIDSEPQGALEINIIKHLVERGNYYNVAVDATNLEVAFDFLVKGLSKKYQFSGVKQPEPGEDYIIKSNVVILIDEYDAPILDHLAKNPELANKNLNILHSFYRKLKNLEPYIHFSFVTGVSQVARIAIGQSASNLNDISLNPDFAGICGFTLTETRNLFGDRFKKILPSLILNSQMKPGSTSDDLEAEILKWYDGYNFDGLNLNGSVRVLNPLSILNFFAAKKFFYYWLASGPAKFLSDLVSKDPERFIDALGSDYSEQTLSAISLDALDPTSLLFQFGYLTIDKVKPRKQNEASRYTLKIPNLEVSSAYREVFLRNVFKIKKESQQLLSEKLKKALISANSQEIGDLLSTALSQLTYYQHVPNETHYHAALHLFFVGLELDARSEMATSWGRPDLVLALAGDVYVCLELKYVPSPDAKLEKQQSAQKIALLKVQLSAAPLTLEQKGLFHDIFPDLSRLSPRQIDFLSSRLLKPVPMDPIQFKDFVFELQDKDDSIQSPSSGIRAFSSKVDKFLDQAAQEALIQIEDKGYVHKYRDQAKAIVEVGVAIYGRDIVWAIARKFEAQDFTVIIKERNATRINKTL
jgi:hypothetical protein